MVLPRSWSRELGVPSLVTRTWFALVGVERCTPAMICTSRPFAAAVSTIVGTLSDTSY